MSETPLPSLDKIKEHRKKTIDSYAAVVGYDSDLGEESLRCSEMHFRFMQVFNVARLAERRAKREQKVLRRTLKDYYRGFLNTKQAALTALGRGPCELALSKDEIDFYVDSDALLLTLTDLVQECEEWVSDCKMILEQIDKRGYALKNALNYLRYKAQMT